MSDNIRQAQLNMYALHEFTESRYKAIDYTDKTICVVSVLFLVLSILTMAVMRNANLYLSHTSCLCFLISFLSVLFSWIFSVETYSYNLSYVRKAVIANREFYVMTPKPMIIKLDLANKIALASLSVGLCTFILIFA